MGITKSKPAAVPQQRVLSEEEKGYREEAVSAYQKRLENSNLKTENVDELALIISDRTLLARNLLELGKERQAHTINRESLRVLLSRAGALDNDLFSLNDTLGEFYKSVQSVTDKLESLKEKGDALKRIDHEKRQEHANALAAAESTGQQNEVESLKAKFLKESKKRHREFTEFLNNEFNPVRSEYEKIRKEGMEKEQTMQAITLQSTDLKIAAIDIMFSLGNAYGAFELALNSIRQYYDKGMIARSEVLLTACLKTNLNAISMHALDGTNENAHELRERGIESALEGAELVENTIAEGKIPVSPQVIPILLHFAVTFRKDAAILSAGDSSISDIDTILVEKAKEYEAKGFKNEAYQLTSVATEILHNVGIRALNAGDIDRAATLIGRAASIRLSLAEDIENQVFSDQNPAQQAPEQMQGTDIYAGGGANQGPSISKAMQLRTDVVNMYLDIHNISEANKVIREAADKYRDNGQEEAYLAMLELGANVASVAHDAGLDLQSLKRDSKKDYTHPGVYL